MKAKLPLKKTLWIGAAILLSIVAICLFFLIGQRPSQEPFYGAHQSGIATPVQKFAFVAAFDLRTSQVEDIRHLFQAWTKAAAALAAGGPLAGNENPVAPTADTGETLGYKPARLTFTFGVGPALFDDRFGLAAQRPAALNPIPAFPGDNLNPQWSDGDLVVQIGADDFQTAYHALHNLTRLAKGVAVPRWVQSGFQPGLEVNTKGPGRNLVGFVDGTVNLDVTKPELMNQFVWVDQGPAWVHGGSYLVIRRIRMFVETWDRSTLADQERTIGRSKTQGEELKPVDRDSHIQQARGAGQEKLLRRPFNYVNGLDSRTGQWDAGLLFLAWMKNPALQYLPMQARISGFDLLNEYIQPVGSAIFAVFPGVAEGDYIGSGLFPSPTLLDRIGDLQARIGALYSMEGRGDWPSVRVAAAAWAQDWAREKAGAPAQGPAIEQATAAWLAALEPANPDPAAVRQAQADLTKALSVWESASQPKTNGADSGISGLKAGLILAKKALEQQDFAGARRAFAEFQGQWPSVEPLVRSLNSAVYSDLELLIGQTRRAIQNPAPAPETSGLIQSMSQKLDTLNPPKAYSAWDAGFILFREGLEALLVLAALLAFLVKTGQKSGRPWIWSGAGAGLVASIGVAAGVSLAMQTWMSAAAPELVEGVAGLVAVVLMLTIGAWLHGKSTVKDWNVWLKARMNQAGNRPWALGALAFLAVLREGAETIVFFWGMAGAIPLPELLIGIAGGLAVLTVLGIAMIGFSKRLPLQVFFPLATGLIYFLVVKILGQSLASLQSVGWLQGTALGFGGPVDWIGFTPTWETALPQLIVAVILGSLLVISLRKRKAA